MGKWVELEGWGAWCEIYRESLKCLNIRDEKRDIASNTTEIQIIRGYFGRLNANKLVKT